MLWIPGCPVMFRVTILAYSAGTDQRAAGVESPLAEQRGTDMIRKGLRPHLALAWGRPDEGERYSEVFAFRRSWVAIAAVAVFDVIFLIPAVTTFTEAVELWSRPDDLFNLVGAMFITFWLLGWSLAPLLLTVLLAMLLFGREVVTARPGEFEVFVGLPFVGLAVCYEAARMRNLRLERPPAKSGKSWRGPHAVFDYGANTGEFGSDLGEMDVAAIRGRIEMATGVSVRRGDARPDELQGEWEPGSPDGRPDSGNAILAVAPPESAVAGAPVSLASASTLVLVLANLVPLAGALFWNWNLGLVMVLYWAESAIIGFFNLCKIIVVGRWAALFAGPFFVGHFGGFMAVHFLFLYTIFVQGSFSDTSASGSLQDVGRLFLDLWPALGALFFSHGYSFFRNFIGRREYIGRTVQNQMSEPYTRIIFMHLVLIFGGALTLALGGATPVLVIVIVLKIVFDVRAHRKQRGDPETKQPPAARAAGS